MNIHRLPLAICWLIYSAVSIVVTPFVYIYDRLNMRPVEFVACILFIVCGCLIIYFAPDALDQYFSIGGYAK